MKMTHNTDKIVDALQSGTDGQVLTPGDAGYDKARTTHFPSRIGHPIAVVRPKHADDVAAVVDTARRTGLSTFVRSGAHHAAAHSTGDGLLLDLRSLDNIDIDAATRTAWAETGLTAGEVAWALEPYGLSIGFGDTALAEDVAQYIDDEVCGGIESRLVDQLLHLVVQRPRYFNGHLVMLHIRLLEH